MFQNIERKNKKFKLLIFIVCPRMVRKRENTINVKRSEWRVNIDTTQRDFANKKQPPQQTMISWSWKWSNNHYGCLGNLHFSQGRKMRNDQYTRTIYIKCNWYIFMLHWHRYAYGVHIKSVTHDYGDDLKHQNQFPNVYIYNACREWVQENPFHIANIQSTYRE